MLQLFAFEAVSKFAVFLKYENPSCKSLIATPEKCSYEFALNFSKDRSALVTTK